MTIDKKININENQVIFKKENGHKHDGVSSNLIDYTKYSIFDFPVYPIAPVGTSRRRFEDTNVKNLESFVISTVENRVLNPKGIAVQANSITAREIASGTITSGELASNVILVNNVIKSKNYDGTVNTQGSIVARGNAGWAITHAGEAEFNNVFIRGSLIAGAGFYAASNTQIFANTGGFFSLGSKFAWDGSSLTIDGNITLTNTNIGTFDNGDSLTDGFIGGININANEIQSTAFSPGSAGFRISANGNAEFNNVTVRGDLRFSDNSIPGTFDNGDALTGGSIGGLSISGTSIQSTDYDATNGFRISSNGVAVFNEVTVRGTVTGSTVSGSTISGSTISGSTFSVTDGSNGLEITSDGYIKAVGVAGVRIKDSDGTTAGTQLFKGLVKSDTIQGSVLSVISHFDARSIGVTISPSDGNTPLILRRNYVAGSNFISFHTGTGGSITSLEYKSTTKVDFSWSSDLRMKEEITNFIGGLDIIKNIRPVNYRMKTAPFGEYEDGFIAQELFDVYPSAVSKGTDEVDDNGDLIKPWKVFYNSFTPVFASAIKELLDKVEQLEARIQTLEGV
jgi:hypothetical protein